MLLWVCRMNGLPHEPVNIPPGRDMTWPDGMRSDLLHGTLMRDN